MFTFLSDFFSTTIIISIGIIFFSAIINILFKKRKRDRALKVFDKYQGIVTMEDGLTIWGTIKVFKNSMEIVYDQPYESHESKQNSYILYSGDLDNIQIIIRYQENLDEEQKNKRYKQLNRIINKGWLLRIFRSITNFFNRLRDAIKKTVSLIIGQTVRRKKQNRFSEVKRQSQNFSEDIISTIDDNLYEEVLEQYIGKPVAVDIICTAASSKEKNAVIEIQGYLADYSDRFITVVNENHSAIEGETIEVKDDVKKDGYSILLHDNKIVIKNEGNQPLVVEQRNSDEILSKILLIKGCFVKFKKTDNPVFKIDEIKRMDAIVPRDLAKIRHSIKNFK